MKNYLYILLLAPVGLLQAGSPELMVKVGKALEGKTIEFPSSWKRDMLETKSDYLQMKARQVIQAADQIKLKPLRKRYYKVANTMLDLAGQLETLPLPKGDFKMVFDDPAQYLTLKARKYQLLADKLAIFAKKLDMPELKERADKMTEKSAKLLKLTQEAFGGVPAAEKESEEVED